MRIQTILVRAITVITFDDEAFAGQFVCVWRTFLHSVGLSCSSRKSWNLQLVNGFSIFMELRLLQCSGREKSSDADSQMGKVYAVKWHFGFSVVQLRLLPSSAHSLTTILRFYFF